MNTPADRGKLFKIIKMLYGLMGLPFSEEAEPMDADLAVFYTLFRAAAQRQKRRNFMAFFNSAVGVLQTLVIALGAGLGVWGVVNLLEGYGSDNPGSIAAGADAGVVGT